MRRLVELLRGLSHFRGDDGERGAIIPMTAICLAVMITSVAFSVDLGMIAYRKRDLRSVADLATLDAARAIDTTGTKTAAEQLGTADAPGPVRAAATASAARNGHVAGGGAAEELTPVMGVWTMSTGFVACANDADCYPNAVRVFAGETVPRYFAFFAEDQPLDLSAVGVNPYAGAGCLAACSAAVPPSSTPTSSLPPAHIPPPVIPTPNPDPWPLPHSTLLSNAGLTLGSFAGRYRTADAPVYDLVLGKLLDVSVSGVAYSGLLTAEVDLSRVAAAMGFGSVDQLLAANVKVGKLLAATADVLEADGASSLSVASLRSMATAVDTTSEIRLDNTYVLSTGTGSVASTSVNAGDLLFGIARTSAAARLGDGTNLSAVTLPIDGDINGDGIDDVSATGTFALIEAPQSASGPAQLAADGTWLTRATSGQVVMSLNLRLENVSLLGTLATVNLPLLLDAGRGTADLTQISCDPLRTGLPSALDAYRSVVMTSAAKAAIGTLAPASLDNSAGSGSFGASIADIATVLVGLVPVDLHSSREVLLAPSSGVADFTDDGMNNDGTPQQHTIGLAPTDGLLSTLLATDEVIFTLDDGGLLDPLQLATLADTANAELRAAISSVSPEIVALIDAVNAGLGVRVGGADVTGGPRPYLPTGPADEDPFPRAADCPPPLPVLVANP
ncbi:MAG: pilus assembly protein TadG-related protein [Acidimicrobiales bacterium]